MNAETSMQTPRARGNHDAPPRTECDRSTENIGKRNEYVDYEGAFDVAFGATYQLRSKAESALEETARRLRAGNVDDAGRLFLANVIDLAQGILEIAHATERAYEKGTWKMLAEHEIVEPVELVKLRALRAELDHATRAEVISSDPPKSRVERQKKHLRVISSAPKSRRAPVSRGAR